MENIVEWMVCTFVKKNNCRTINVDKTYSMMLAIRVIGHENFMQLSLDGGEIMFMRSGKFLSIAVYDRLNFNLHIGLAGEKLSKIVRIFYIMQSLVPNFVNDQIIL